MSLNGLDSDSDVMVLRFTVSLKPIMTTRSPQFGVVSPRPTSGCSAVWSARLAWNQEARGSNPLSLTQARFV